jgi:hypothetical protein
MIRVHFAVLTYKWKLGPAGERKAQQNESDREICRGVYFLHHGRSILNSSSTKWQDAPSNWDEALAQQADAHLPCAMCVYNNTTSPFPLYRLQISLTICTYSGPRLVSYPHAAIEE